MSTKNSCRACLGITPKMVSIFEPYRSFDIAHFITSFTKIKINKGHNNLPESLCSDCLEKLEVVLNFSNQCKETDKYLRSLSPITIEPCEFTRVKEEPTEEIKLEDYLLHESDILECEIDQNMLVDDEDELDVDLKKEPFSFQVEPFNNKQPLTYYECHDCGEKLRTKCKLRVHWKRTHKFSFTCDKCKRVFKSFHPYKRHCQSKCVNLNIVKIVPEGKRRRFHCKQCDYNTLSYNNFKVHANSHIGKRMYSCNICSKAYSQRSGLYDHKETAHQIYRVEMTCDQCGKHVKGRGKCYTHLQTHLKATYQCDLCKAFLKNKKSLGVHIKRHYGKISSPAACEICGKVFSHYSGLKKHIRLIHFITIHRCKMCKYQHKNIACVKKHERSHFTENMLQCSLCYIFFEGQSKFDRHMHNDHGSKSHFCVFCKRGFKKRYTVLNHQQKKHAEHLKGHSGPTYIRVSSTASNSKKKKKVLTSEENI